MTSLEEDLVSEGVSNHPFKTKGDCYALNTLHLSYFIYGHNVWPCSVKIKRSDSICPFCPTIETWQSDTLLDKDYYYYHLCGQEGLILREHKDWWREIRSCYIPWWYQGNIGTQNQTTKETESQGRRNTGLFIPPTN